MVAYFCRTLSFGLFEKASQRGFTQFRGNKKISSVKSKFLLFCECDYNCPPLVVLPTSLQHLKFKT